MDLEIDRHFLMGLIAFLIGAVIARLLRDPFASGVGMMLVWGCFVGECVDRGIKDILA